MRRKRKRSRPSAKQRPREISQETDSSIEALHASHHTILRANQGNTFAPKKSSTAQFGLQLWATIPNSIMLMPDTICGDLGAGAMSPQKGLARRIPKRLELQEDFARGGCPRPELEVRRTTRNVVANQNAPEKPRVKPTPPDSEDRLPRKVEVSATTL